jgi:hypothetical protein
MQTLCCAAVGGLGVLFFAGVALAQEDRAAAAAVAKPAGTSPVETSVIDVNEIDRVDECIDAMVCIDRYLWSLYERTRKIDAVKVENQIKVAVKRKGKIKIVAQTTSRWVMEDFGWKDPDAARKAGVLPKDYVIGGMDPGFRVTLYHALRALEAAGLMPGITSAFRDNYRQTIASGQKAQTDRSYHGGSFRGGYGHGMAADVVSVKGATRAERLASSDELWRWIDVHEKQLGIARPYLDRDAPHVGPLEGQEYFTKRIEPTMRRAEKMQQADKAHPGEKTHRADSKSKGRQEVALHSDRGPSKRTKASRPARVQTKPMHST